MIKIYSIVDIIGHEQAILISTHTDEQEAIKALEAYCKALNKGLRKITQDHWQAFNRDVRIKLT